MKYRKVSINGIVYYIHEIYFKKVEEIFKSHVVSYLQLAALADYIYDRDRATLNKARGPFLTTEDFIDKALGVENGQASSD
jgi:hypothetical protein